MGMPAFAMALHLAATKILPPASMICVTVTSTMLAKVALQLMIVRHSLAETVLNVWTNLTPTRVSAYLDTLQFTAYNKSTSVVQCLVRMPALASKLLLRMSAPVILDLLGIIAVKM
jgi:hypothetical protein